MTDSHEVERTFDQIVDQHGGAVDVLVNNVGGTRNRPIWELSVEDWDFTRRLNLRSMFFVLVRSFHQ